MTTLPIIKPLDALMTRLFGCCPSCKGHAYQLSSGSRVCHTPGCKVFEFTNTGQPISYHIDNRVVDGTGLVVRV